MRKLIVAVVLTAFVGLTYLFYSQQEAKMLDQLKAQIEEYGIISESVEFDTVNQKIILENVKYEKKIDNVNFKANAKLIVLAGFENSSADGQEIIINEVKAENFSGEAIVNNGIYTKIIANNLNGSDLVINEANLKKIINSEHFDFANVFFAIPHSGIEYLGGLVEYKATPDDSALQTSFDRLYLKPHTSMDNVSFEYENIKIVDEKAEITVQNTLVEALNAELVFDLLPKQSTKDIFEEIFDKLQNKMELPFEKSIFSNITLKNIGILVKDASIDKIEDKEITIDSLHFSFDNKDNFTMLSNLDNLEISSEYFTKADPSLEALFSGNLPEQLVLSYKSKNIINPNEKIRIFEVDSELTSFFDALIKTESIYSCENIWDVVFMTQNGLACQGITHYNQEYTDEGLIPFVTTLVADSFGLPVEAVIKFVEETSNDFLEHIESGDAKTDDAIAELLNAMVAMIKKPGKLAFDFKFNDPVYVLELEELPTNFEHKITLEQGDKTLEELVKM